MKHLGDISKINGAEIEPVDIITFGSPCQDLSVAGKRAGIGEGTRSGLFIEAVRIIKEMRRATDGKYPTFALWENVPGAFSSNGGEDFRTVLEELIKIVEPSASVPPVPKGGWAYADSYVGDGWSLAYRVLNAEHWGVAQRRRRLHACLDLRGQRAREVLFEREGLRGYFKQSRTPWEDAPARAQGGAGAGSQTFVIDNLWGKAAYAKPSTVNPTLRAGALGAVAYDVSRGREATISPTLDTVDPNPNKNQGGLAMVMRSYCKSSKTKNADDAHAVIYDYAVRRLTPTECARLQGFPDDWGELQDKTHLSKEEHHFWTEVRNTHAAINGRAVKDYTAEQMLKWYNKLQSDSAQYKMWGNGIALPTALYCMQGMADALERTSQCEQI